MRQAISLAIWCNVGRPEQGEGQCDTHNLAHRLRNHGTLLQLPIGSSLSPSSMIPRERKNVRWPLIRQLAIRRAHRDWIRLAVLRSIVGGWCHQEGNGPPWRDDDNHYTTYYYSGYCGSVRVYRIVTDKLHPIISQNHMLLASCFIIRCLFKLVSGKFSSQQGDSQVSLISDCRLGISVRYDQKSRPNRGSWSRLNM